MKRKIFTALLFLSSLFLVGCNKTAEVNNYDLGNYAQYSFGVFTINGFKRVGDKFYFSYEIDPIEKEPNEITLNELSYFINDKSTNIGSLIVPLVGKKYKGLYCITSNQSIDINGIGLVYEKNSAKWNFSSVSGSGGDTDFIDNSLNSGTIMQLDQSNQNEQQNQIQAQQQQLETEKQILENQKIELEKQKQQNLNQQNQDLIASQEQNSLGNAWATINNYGKTLYPEGFILQDKIFEERNDDGSWYLAAFCEVIEPNGEIVDTMCDATIRGSNQNWNIEEFFVDDNF